MGNSHLHYPQTEDIVMIALLDCNSFFCSVERAFHPGLQDKPVCVLSSNDVCIVALTSEAKALGLRRGDPLFKVRDIVEANNVRLFSGNMMLYSAMSRRIVSILRKSVSRVENYSIDESFCYLDGYELYDPVTFMRGVADKIRLWTDIPVSVGIAPTKTLAKVGSKFAKNYSGYHGVCMIDTDEKRRRALELSALSDIWGIGRRTLRRLDYYGVRTPLDFADRSEAWVSSRFEKPVVHTWKELNCTPCIDTEESVMSQSVCVSRSFGEMVSDLTSLKASVAGFAAGCANKLRAQKAGARTVRVFLRSNRFRTDLEQYENAAAYTFMTPTSDTLEITDAAMKLLETIYRPGVCYKKSGVILGDVSALSGLQQDLFDPVRNRDARMSLMGTMDRLNRKYGLKTVHLSAEDSPDSSWKVKSEFRSGNYMTDINDLLTVRI